MKNKQQETCIILINYTNREYCHMNLAYDFLQCNYQNKTYQLIDEQMIVTKPGISLMQYIPKKSKQFGIKLWVLCEARIVYCLQTEGAAHGQSCTVLFGLS